MRRSAAFAIRAAAILITAVAAYWIVVLPYRGNLVLRQVANNSAMARAAEPSKGAVVARENLDQLEAIAPGRRLDPAWYMLYAANCEMLERLPEAERAYTRALRVDDRPELYVNRAAVRLRLGRTDDAVRDLAFAARFDPSVLQPLPDDLRARAAAAAGLP